MRAHSFLLIATVHQQFSPCDTPPDCMMRWKMTDSVNRMAHGTMNGARPLSALCKLP